jgi:hypothetical protein
MTLYLSHGHAGKKYQLKNLTLTMLGWIINILAKILFEFYVFTYFMTK